MSQLAESVLVTGDLVQDHYLYEGQQRRGGSLVKLGTVPQQTSGGAALLAKLLDEVANPVEKAKSAERKAKPDEDAKATTKFTVVNGWDVDKALPQSPQGFCVMRPVPKSNDKKDKKVTVWRIAEALGFSTGATKLDMTAINATALATDHRVVVIDEAGLQFRRWTSRDAWPQFLIDAARPMPEWLVIKLSGPPGAGDLWHTIVSGETQDDKSPKVVRPREELLRRTIAVLSINDLRNEPLMVTRKLSWERAALDLVEEFRTNPHLESLRSLRCVVVSLGTDGALIVESSPDGTQSYRLIFDPARLEGDFVGDYPGTVVGYQTCLTAAIVTQLLSPSAAAANPLTLIEQGTCRGLSTMRRLIAEGHGELYAKTPPGFPFKALASEIRTDNPKWTYGAVDVPGDLKKSESWTIVAGRSNSTAESTIPLFGLARRVAIHGLKQLQHTPYLKFGKLFSIERSEIESLRTIHQLVETYRNDKKAEKPLSIAAFGPPGSGKSFGVKQIASAIFGDDAKLLEFNLSQLENASDLHGLFHQIRDEVLRGKLPLVFWDEFDSCNLKWLQYLLGPMQDGTFHDGQVTHPIGKCIFVFAGGTSERFEDFAEPPADLLKEIENARAKTDADLDRKLKERLAELRAELRLKKAPDFKSRVAGYINVLGPNPPKDGSRVDITYPVRRALLLRVHLGCDDGHCPIDTGVLNAFLRIGQYHHGSRSLEKIAEQVRLSSRHGNFTRSDVPTAKQLALHVDADEFLKIMELK